MSRKWQQVKRWDDEHLTGALLPVNWVLRLFSSVLFGVGLLVVVAIYGALASLPVGLLITGLTWTIYGLTLVGCMALVGGGAMALAARLSRSGERGWRFFFIVMAMIIGGLVAIVGWYHLAWPHLRYDSINSEGFRVFGAVADEYADVTIRRLPFFEMTELEFYSWWPLRIVLVMFVITMIVSTVRRIAFNLPNLGVLTVHTGIILLGLGSIYYGAMKLEGDVLLLAGSPGRDGMPTEGPPQGGFYDRIKVALWVNQGRGWDQRLVRGVPRYNAYNLNAGLGESALEAAEVIRPIEEGQSRSLAVSVPPSRSGVTDGDIQYRIVGYAPYAEQQTDWVSVPPPKSGPANPLRFVELYSRVPVAGLPGDDTRPMFRFFFVPGQPRLRLAQIPMFVVDYRMGLDEASWREFTAPAPAEARHALAITMPGEDGPTVIPIEEGRTFEWRGLSYEVEQLLPEPPFPIITEGFENTTSSVAIVRITEGDEVRSRWIYSRFPEISQDLLEGEQEGGMPNRSGADEDLVRIRYLDLTGLHVVIDEREDGLARVAVREPGNTVRVIEDVAKGQRFSVLDAIDLKRSGSWDHAEEVKRPVPVPEIEREGEFIGTHDRAMVAVEITVPATPEAPEYKRVVWLEFLKYLNIGQREATRVELPDGRSVRLAFGRARRVLPGFQVRMVDFEMVAYDHRGAPRDYRSTVRVEPIGGVEWFQPYVRKTQLNAPLRAPFVWSDERNAFMNTLGFVGSRLDPAQFKFAQAGWDAQGWEETQVRADLGEIPGPYAQFTILLVGNNPGIHVIALGGVLMGIGTPWAFYIKPWMLKRRKAKVLAEHERKKGSSKQPDPIAPSGAAQEITA